MLRYSHEAGSVHNHFFESQNAGESTCRRLHLFQCCRWLPARDISPYYIPKLMATCTFWQNIRQSTTETVWLQRSPNGICDGVFHTMCRAIAYIGSTWFTRQWMVQRREREQNEVSSIRKHRKQGDEPNTNMVKTRSPFCVANCDDVMIILLLFEYGSMNGCQYYCLPCLCI